MSDPIVEIDMQDPANFRKAIRLALASPEPEAWGGMKTAELHALAGTSEKLWSVWKDQNRPDGASVIAITGNGPSSQASAEFFASARKIVLGLVAEVDRLRCLLKFQQPGGEGGEAGAGLPDDPREGKGHDGEVAAAHASSGQSSPGDAPASLDDDALLAVRAAHATELAAFYGRLAKDVTDEEVCSWHARLCAHLAQLDAQEAQEASEHAVRQRSSRPINVGWLSGQPLVPGDRVRCNGKHLGHVRGKEAGDYLVQIDGVEDDLDTMGHGDPRVRVPPDDIELWTGRPNPIAWSRTMKPRSGDIVRPRAAEERDPSVDDSGNDVGGREVGEVREDVDGVVRVLWEDEDGDPDWDEKRNPDELEVAVAACKATTPEMGVTTRCRKPTGHVDAGDPDHDDGAVTWHEEPPAAVQVLLWLEWIARNEEREPCCPSCGAARAGGLRFATCGDEDSSLAPDQHRRACRMDACLTNAGLAHGAGREEVRRRLVEREPQELAEFVEALASVRAQPADVTAAVRRAIPDSLPAGVWIPRGLT